MLNDNFVNSDLQGPHLHLFYGRRVQQFPQSYVDGMDIRERTDKLTQLIGEFSSQWKREYLGEYYKKQATDKYQRLCTRRSKLQ